MVNSNKIWDPSLTFFKEKNPEIALKGPGKRTVYIFENKKPLKFMIDQSLN
jgi:hypothetical protein